MTASSARALTVRDLMSPKVTTVTPTTSVGDVLDLMFEQKISALPVVDDNQCIGIVTATDLVALLRATDKLLRSDYPHFEDCLWAVDLVQRKLDDDPVREIMSEVMVTTTPDALVDQVAKTMLKESIHHLPVVGKEGQLIGFLSSLDFVRGWSI